MAPPHPSFLICSKMTTQIGKGFYFTKEWQSQVNFREEGTNAIQYGQKKERENDNDIKWI